MSVRINSDTTVRSESGGGNHNMAGRTDINADSKSE
jgi:hypothetical protein